jgi:hypothetical protein
MSLMKEQIGGRVLAEPVPWPSVQDTLAAGGPAMMADPAEPRATAGPALESAVAITNGPPLMVARGIGGRLELYDNCIRIRRDGYVNYLLNWLAKRPAFIDTIIPLEEIASFDIIQPVLFNDFVNISYPGSPPLTGQSLYDAMSENSLLMNFLDNREFYAVKREFQRITARPLLEASGRSFLRRRARPPDAEG